MRTPTKQQPAAAEPDAPLSSRFAPIRRLVDARVLDLAAQRITTGKSFFCKEKLLLSDPESVVKLALLLAQEINPLEEFSIEEEALIRGICSKTLRRKYGRGEMK
jgi:hypothetical protein